MEVNYVLAGVLVLLIIGVHSENPNAQQQPNKVASTGLWNSIGEGLKTPGKAMPTQIHLPHDIENPGMTNKQIIKSYKGKCKTLLHWSKSKRNDAPLQNQKNIKKYG